MFDVGEMLTITPGARLDDLTAPALTAVQRALAVGCYDVGKVDGLIGRRTRTAYSDFCDDAGEPDPTVVTGPATERLRARVDEVVSTCQTFVCGETETPPPIVAACERMGLGLRTQIAYVLATAKWETNHTFEPVREAYWLSDPEAHLRTLSYYPYYGRGFVQLTHEQHYDTYGRIFGLDFVENPDWVMRPEVSLFVLVHGMRTGHFTGKRLDRYVNTSETDFEGARRVINGTDRKAEIAAIAKSYVGTL